MITRGAYYAELIWDLNENGYKDHYHYELFCVEKEKKIEEIKSIFPNGEDSKLFWESKQEMVEWMEKNKSNPLFGFPQIIKLIKFRCNKIQKKQKA